MQSRAILRNIIALLFLFVRYFPRNIIRTLIIIMGINENKIHKFYIHFKLFINNFTLLQIDYLNN